MEIIWRASALNDLEAVREFMVAYRVVENQVRILAVIQTSRQWPRRS
jgi:plasmid stabilization system protein ParE